MSAHVIERPRTAGPGSGLGGAWKVIVLNDSHNTFEGVAAALSRTLPGVSFDEGLRHADRIHSAGLAVVWSGHQELAEHYHAQLQGCGLTMAPLEQG